MAGQHSVSVIIATKGRRDTILGCLESLTLQTEAPDEVVVVDQDPTDSLGPIASAAIEGSGINLTYLWRPDVSGLAQARNVGFNESIGKIVLFLDDDVTLCPTYLGEVLRIFEEDATSVVGGVGGYVIGTKGVLSRFKRWFWVGPFADLREEFQANPAPRFQTNSLAGCNMAYRRTVYEKNRARESLTGYSYGEDWELSVRISRSHDLILTSDAQLYHHQSQLNRLDMVRLIETMLRNMNVFYHSLYSFEERSRLSFRAALAWFRTGIAISALFHLLRGRPALFRVMALELARQVKHGGVFYVPGSSPDVRPASSNED